MSRDSWQTAVLYIKGEPSTGLYLVKLENVSGGKPGTVQGSVTGFRRTGGPFESKTTSIIPVHHSFRHGSCVYFEKVKNDRPSGMTDGTTVCPAKFLSSMTQCMH